MDVGGPSKMWHRFHPFRAVPHRRRFGRTIPCMRSSWIPVAAAAGLVAGGAAFFAAGGPGFGSSRPDATGGPGRVTVYGQRAAGPVRLIPGRAQVLPRPQELVFHLVIDGTGPRDVRIEAETEGRRRVLYEARWRGPVEGRYLDFSVPLDERAPDRWTLVVVVEPPHQMNLESRYPIALVGSRGALRGGSRGDAGAPGR